MSHATVSPLKGQALKNWLEDHYQAFNQTSFISTDPISIPHRFAQSADIEISGFFTAIIAWGQRKTILRNAWNLMERMDEAPHQFIVQHLPSDLKKMEGFVHRTFNDTDLLGIISVLKDVYIKRGTMESIFKPNKGESMEQGLIRFKEIFQSHPDFQPRSGKHISSPLTGSACKRLNMFLRWMIRHDTSGVDFGIWKSISPSYLMIPLDVHTGRTARNLGILHRSYDDWQAVVELTNFLKKIDPVDPVRFDFALYGAGINPN